MGKRNLHMIEELLERYFEGETSAAEEKADPCLFRFGRGAGASGCLCPLFAYFDEEIERDAEAQVGEPDLGTRTGIRSVPLCEPEACSPFTSFPAWQLVYWLCWELPACCIPLIPVSVPTAMS